jgi:phosphate-selective porin OprO and OprP
MFAQTRWTWLGATALIVLSAPAAAQDADARIEALQAQIRALQAQLDALKAEVAQAKSAPAGTAKPTEAAMAKPPAWKGAPEFSGPDGVKFKVRGRLMYDVAHVENPNKATLGVSTLGFNSRVRRLRLGAEGALPGGFAYKAISPTARSATATCC